VLRVSAVSVFSGEIHRGAAENAEIDAEKTSTIGTTQGELVLTRRITEIEESSTKARVGNWVKEQP